MALLLHIYNISGLKSTFALLQRRVQYITNVRTGNHGSSTNHPHERTRNNNINDNKRFPETCNQDNQHSKRNLKTIENDDDGDNDNDDE